MRITGGEFRGRVFRPPVRPNFRPSMEKVRQAVFSMLDSLGGIEGAVVLDCFAGSGAYGFEALSRGAERVVFVEGDRELCAFIEKTAKALALEGRIRVVCGKLPNALEQVSGSFSLIFSDPPYEAYSSDFDVRLMTGGLLANGGLLVSEAGKKSEDSATLNLELLRDKSYGDSRVRIYRAQTLGESSGSES